MSPTWVLVPIMYTQSGNNKKIASHTFFLRLLSLGRVEEGRGVAGCVCSVAKQQTGEGTLDPGGGGGPPPPSNICQTRY